MLRTWNTRLSISVGHITVCKHASLFAGNSLYCLNSIVSVCDFLIRCVNIVIVRNRTQLVVIVTHTDNCLIENKHANSDIWVDVSHVFILLIPANLSHRGRRAFIGEATSQPARSLSKGTWRTLGPWETILYSDETKISLFGLNPGIMSGGNQALLITGLIALLRWSIVATGTGRLVSRDGNWEPSSPIPWNG